jgi:ABC-type transport system substrate-binding protein
MDNQQGSQLSRSSLFKVAAGSAAAASAFSGPIILLGNRAEAAPAQAPVRGGTLTASVNEEIKILDPHASELSILRTFRENVWDTLVYHDLEHAPVTLKPRLATSWGYKDPITFELTLRSGVKFHDGASFDAEDVKFNLDRVLDPKLNSYLASQLGPVDKVVVVDSTHVRILMKQPYAALAEGLGHICILSKSVTQANLTQQPIGTGPFRFVGFRPGAYIKLQRFDGYWDPGIPYLDGITFPYIPDNATRVAALESGQTDMLINLTPNDAPTLIHNPNLVVLPNKVRNLGDIFYINSHRPPLNNVMARQALSYMIDRQTFYKVFLNGYGYANCSPFDQTNWAYDPKEGAYARFAYNLDTAKSYLAKAGYPNGKGFHLVFCLVAGFPELLQGAQMLQAVVAKLGGTMDIVTQEVTGWVDTIEKTFNYDVSSDYSNGAAADPASTLADKFQFAPDGIISRYHNPTITKLLADGAAKLTPTARRPYYWQYQTIWNQNLYGMILGKRDQLSGSTKRVQGFIENPSHYRNFRYTYLTK